MTHAALNAIIGVSAAIVGLRELIRAIAPTKLSVLIEGATGSGKELVAAAIHEESGRKGAFVPFNVCAIGDSMFEDALFGHVRGAFTGATSDSLGFLREANGGTVFLDEISGLLVPLQAKLLRAIETGRFRPVGARTDATSQFRVVAATNEPSRELIKDGRLRADLVHRLGGVTISVPPLRDRREDIPELVKHFVGAEAGERAIPSDAMVLLVQYDWPGNVRELRNVVACASALGGLSARNVNAMIEPHPCGQIDRVAARRNELRAKLDAHKWNADAVARDVGVHRATVYRWMRDIRH